MVGLPSPGSGGKAEDEAREGRVSRSIPKGRGLGGGRGDKGWDGDGAGEAMGELGVKMGMSLIQTGLVGVVWGQGCPGAVWVGVRLDAPSVRAFLRCGPWEQEARTSANRPGGRWRVWVLGERLAARKRRRSPEREALVAKTSCRSQPRAGGLGMPRK